MEFSSNYEKCRIDATFFIIAVLALFNFTLNSSTAYGQSLPLSSVELMMDRYAEILLDIPDERGRRGPLVQLIEEISDYIEENPDDPHAYIARGRMRFTYANSVNFFRGRRLLNEAKEDLERAITMDRNVQNGFGLIYLGYLYGGGLPKPVGYHDFEKAYELLEEGLSVDVNAPNLMYYAQVLMLENRYDEAEEKVILGKEYAESNPVSSPRLQEFYIKAFTTSLARYAEEDRKRAQEQIKQE